MKESDTYQCILEQGALQEARRLVLIGGESCLGVPPGEHFKETLEGITDLARLERMALRAFKGASWKDVLQTP
jgi:hypothetical protein